MEAQQCVELTGTNRPRACHTPNKTWCQQTHNTVRVHYTISQPTNTLVGFPPHPGCGMTTQECFGGHCARETPGPIPNPEAKPCSADGTAPEGVWESRTPPNTPQQGEQGAPHKRAGLLLVFPHKPISTPNARRGPFPYPPMPSTALEGVCAVIRIPAHGFDDAMPRPRGSGVERSPWCGCRALCLVWASAADLSGD